ncbi:ATP synthase subunit e, mitochondrial, partial [Eschrichtius robustus]|nr:ATP synthase subunit e, mitochondrial [Eschrichtius robustus]
MVPPMQVSPLRKLGGYTALFLSVAYRESQALQLPETQAEEERRIAAEEKTKQDELKRIERTDRNPRGRHIKVSLHFSGAMWISKVFCAV